MYEKMLTVVTNSVILISSLSNTKFKQAKDKMTSLQHLHSREQLSQSWLGQGSLCSDRSYRFEPVTAFCVSVDGINKV